MPLSLADQSEQLFYMIDWRVRHDPMPEIEDMWTVSKCRQYIAHCAFQIGAACNQGERIEIALNWQALGQLTVGPMRIDGFVEPERVDAGSFSIGCKFAACAFGKTDY
jgi:hypothetical protein